MNSTRCKGIKPITGALEDALTVFLYCFLTAIASIVVLDSFDTRMLLLPVVISGIQGVRTYATLRQIELVEVGDRNEKEKA